MFNISTPNRTTVLCIAAVTSHILLTWLHVRPLGSLFLLTFCFWYYKTRCSWELVVPPELLIKIDHIKEYLGEFYRDHPNMFRGGAATLFLGLSYLGLFLSDNFIVLILIIIAICLQGLFDFKWDRRYPEVTILQTAPSDENEQEDQLMRMYFPEVNETNLFILERASDSAALTTSPNEDGDGEEEDKSDEIPSELLIPDAIPEIDESSTDDDNDDLIPVVNAQSSAVYHRSDPRNLSYDINYKKSHFKSDSTLSSSSSSSVDSIGKGLSIPDDHIDAPSSSRRKAANSDTVDSVHMQTAVDEAISATLLPHLLTSISLWNPFTSDKGSNGSTGKKDRLATAHEELSDASDGSDFEIINQDDYK